MRICTLRSHTSIRRSFWCSFRIHFPSKPLTVGIMAGKAAPKKQNNRANPISKNGKEDKPAKEKNPKDSHLYTDDNPETTLQGTGFKDVTTANNTISLVSKRSLLYQWQTINTMYNRAKHHPKKTKDMEAAMEIFHKWLKETYPKQKSDLRVFKPLQKKTVELFLTDLQKAKGIDTKFAELYVKLEPRKKLANVLVDDTKPGEQDWDKARVDALSELVSDKDNEIVESELWEKDGVPSNYHLSLIAWAWSPLTEYKLLKGTNKG